ncbi:MAG: hypothetical protein ACR2PK_14350, partial [Acidimicrobiales bacterium]
MGAGAESKTDERRASLGSISDRVAPLVLAEERRFVVSPALDHLLPDGLKQGSVVGTDGVAALSLGLAVAAGPVESGSWVATIGCDELNAVAAEQAGVNLHRMILVAQPPRDNWGSVAAALIDAFDVILISGRYPIRSRDASRLTARVRERGGVIIDVANSWPVVHDLVMRGVDQRWLGLGNGHGAISAREVVVEVSGRRGVQPREGSLWLPGPQLIPEAAEPESFAGADVEQLVHPPGGNTGASEAGEGGG